MKLLSVLGLFLMLFFVGCGDEPDVVTTDSGLKYVVEKEGDGKVAEMGDIVSVNFQGWFITDSAEENLFDDWTKDSLKNNQSLGSSNEPIKFKLGSGTFIRGTDEGIAGMKVGERRTMIIPSNLAYGAQGLGPVPPNANLKLVIELVETKDVAEVKQWDADTTNTKSTGSGLKYIILEEGTGETPDSGDVVEVHYSGYLRDGTKFDSSVERDQPLTFTLGKGMVIPGWDEGIALLKEGGKAKFIIPPDLAYGERPIGQIPPNSTLIFDVELLDIKTN